MMDRALATLLALHATSTSVLAQVDPINHQAFADVLTSNLYTEPNECTSALGVSMAMSLLYPGTTNNATLQVQQTLGYPSGSNLELVWEDTTQRLLDGASGQCLGGEFNGVCNSDAPTLKIANSIWYDDDDTLTPAYDSIVGEYAIQTDFESPDSPIIVNEWVEESTNGMIDSIVDEDEPLFPPYVLIAINSIYLKARWVHQFFPGATNEDVFYESSERKKEVSDKVHFMNTVEYFPYSHDVLAGYQVIELPFVESQMSMIFVLPTVEDLDEVSSVELMNVMDEDESLVSTYVALSLPKFKFESEYDDSLKEALIASGVVDPFVSGTQSLCGIFEDESYCDKLIIDKFIQKSIIDVNEKGVEAAAVTAAMAVPTSIGPPPPVPVLMTLDHPFQFFIVDKAERLALFEGRLGEPEEPEEDPEVDLLDAERGDEAFWTANFGVDPTDPPPYEIVETTTTSTEAETTTTTTSTEVDTTATTPEPQQLPETTTVPDPQQISEASIDTMDHQEFADELTPLIYKNPNECSSSLGVSMAFSLIWPGTMGDAIEQIRDTLRYPDGTNMQLVWEDITQSMLEGADGECLWESGGECQSSKPLLKIANSVWFDEDNELNAEYEMVVEDYAMQTDFEAEESPMIVNEWVSDSTNGLIDSIVPEDKPLFPPYVLLAINSIYLKAQWAEQFQKFHTNLDTFYDSYSRSSEVSTARFMHMVDYFRYSHDALPGYQVIDMPFAESQMSMLFVLPLSDDAATVHSTDLITATGALQSTRVALALPKFKFESMYDDDLKDALMQLGIEAPFQEVTGALCGLFEDTTNCEQIIIDKVIQKTVIDVNEEGVEAAAVTAVMAGITSVGPPPPVPTLMVLDHPFQFFIYDKDEELMLFEGRVGAPEVPEGSPDVALLDDKHSDREFWMNAFGVEPGYAPEYTVGTTGSTPQAIEENIPPDETSSTSPPTEPAGTSTSTTEPTEASASSTTTTTSTEPAGSFTTTTTPTDPSDPTSSGPKRGTPALTIAFLVYALAFAL